MDPMMSRRNFATAVATLIMFSSVGCATMSDKKTSDKSKPVSLMDRMPWADKDSDEKPEPYPNPTKLAATWTPDTLIQTGRTPTRGFGGRLFFYDEKSRPVPVEGTLVVHGFDENAPDPKKSVKRFEFTPEQFTKHFSQGDLGASYSIWIPWDAVGGERKRISLVASFKTGEGRPVQGIPASVMLPGTEPEKSSDKLAQLSPKFREYKAALVANKPRKSGLTTTTIARRSHQPTSSSAPAINVPTTDVPSLDVPSSFGSRSMLAKTGATPSAEITLSRRPGSSAILPASAEAPVKRSTWK